MTATLLAELSDLFSLEALEADRHGDPKEAERLWDISNALHKSCQNAACVQNDVWSR
jgi:hypothetical protein